MIEPRSTATIRALASLAELSANQLEEGVSVEEVIATLRKAAEAVRLVVDQSEEDDLEVEEDEEAEEDENIVQDLTPMTFSLVDADEETAEMETETDEEEAVEEQVLNAG